MYRMCMESNVHVHNKTDWEMISIGGAYNNTDPKQSDFPRENFSFFIYLFILYLL